jgi:hypothetical protein
MDINSTNKLLAYHPLLIEVVAESDQNHKVIVPFGFRNKYRQNECFIMVKMILFILNQNTTK